MDNKRHNRHQFRKTLVAAACAVPYLLFAGGGVNTAHAAGEDEHAHTTTRAARRTDLLEVYLGPDDFNEHDVAVEVTGDWSYAADIRYDNEDNYYNDGPPVGAATFSDMDFKASGESALGVLIGGFWREDDTTTVNIRDSLIKVDGVSALGMAVSGYVRVHLENVDLNVNAVAAPDNPWALSGGGISAWDEGARVDVSGGAMRVENGFGVELINGASLNMDYGQIRAWGNDTAHGLMLTEFAIERLMPGNTVKLARGSVVEATDASAVWVNGQAVNQVDARDSRVSGDRLVTVNEYRSPNGPAGGSKLVFNAANSQLVGGADVHELARLSLNLQDRSDWEIRPGAAGQTRSDVTFLSLQDSDIRFNSHHTGLYQRLVVGHGDTDGRTDVYQALGGNARISINTFLNEGGELARQQTDRIVINGDARGTTWLQVNPVAGSPGAETGDTARDGISVVQVYGSAASDSFKLLDDYVAVGAYQYRLQSFDPDASDPGQRDAAGQGGSFWDYRLLGAMGQSGFGDSSTPDVVPQLPSYLAAPTAIFQARLFDIDTWHRRLGDARHADALSGQNGEGGSQSSQRDFYLRSYGGDYDYRSQSGGSSYASSTRYHAVQAGGNAISADKDGASWRIGAAASAGDLSFQPRGIDGNRKTQLTSWTVSPTVTWQHQDGAYVDALVAVGGFKGDVSTRQRGKTATLKGKSAAASVEVGVPFKVGEMTVLPQAQAVVQHLKFDRTRDADGINVNLGTHKQVTLRTGGEWRKALQTQAGHAIQVYGKVHVAHTLNDSKKVDLSGDFRTGKTGTVLETGIGMDAALAKGRGVVYADLTRQNRIGRAGHNGWTANVGVRVRF